MRLFTRILSVAAFAWAASAAAQTSPPPVEAFGALPRIADAAISPDGSKLVVATQVGDVSAMDIYDLNTNQRLGAVSVDRRAQSQGVRRTQLRGVGWADDGHITFDVSETMDIARVATRVMTRGNRLIDYWRPGVYNLETRRVRFLTTQEDRDEGWREVGATLVAPIEGDPGYGRLIGWSEEYALPRLVPFRVNLDNGAVRIAEAAGANQNTVDYELNANGDVIARADADRESNRWSLYIYHQGQPRLLREGVSEIGQPEASILGVLSDGRMVLYERGADRSTLHAVNPADGSSEVLFRRDGREVGGVVRDPWTRQVVGVVWNDDGGRREFYDPALRAAAAALDQSFPSGMTTLASWSRDRSRILVYREDGLDGGGYYIFEPGRNSMRQVAMRYPQLATANLGERLSIAYRARDGTQIPAFLTLPANAGEHPRDLPLVLLVHGGPHAADTDRFDWWSAFLASRGYAVLQPNYRGSTGYGQAWEYAGRREWGGLMQTDVEDGVAALIRNGMVDASRVCIVGASYGGYAALAGATLTPDRYACAASIAGVSDLLAMLNETVAQGGRRGSGIEWWTASIGDRIEDRERINSVSPANLAERVRIPILLMHGTDDTVVPIAQSRLMERRLRAANKDVRFVELGGDDHWLSDGPTRMQMLSELETFLHEHIGAGAN
jgi:dipeptidyl aminopeptidase/acylaminoacyl peptidase